MHNATATSPSDTRLHKLERRLHEAFDSLWNDFVDPSEPYLDDGDRWIPLATPGNSHRAGAAGTISETQLADIRGQSRALAVENEFAINAFENRVSYIVGSGHTYHAVVRKGREVPEHLPREAQAWLDEFLHENDWPHRQQEIIRRYDRDGEVFLRMFANPSGALRVRFVEPDQIATPASLSGDTAASFGIHTEPHDVETAVAYYVDGQRVPGEQIQHRKANVDANVKRGLPLLYPVRKNLRRAEKLLRNMSVVAEIQSAIALIRKHRSASRGGVQQFVSRQADATISSSSGSTRHVQRFGPGTILDAPAGLEYDFPASAIDAGNYVAILQAELRAIASRLVMPEFMLTSDASNANYSSTLVAEGPAVKMFGRMQATHIQFDRQVMRRVMQHAIDAGRLPSDVLEAVEIQIVPPSLATRDLREEAEVHRIAHTAGVLSPQTWSQRLGLDYDQEQKNFSQHVGAGE